MRVVNKKILAERAGNIPDFKESLSAKLFIMSKNFPAFLIKKQKNCLDTFRLVLEPCDFLEVSIISGKSLEQI